MVDEAQALALLHEANPVPDLDSYDVVEADVTAYLATLEARSNQVTQLNTKPPSKESRRIPIGAWLVAAAAVVVLGAAIFLMTQNSGEAPVATTPTATTLSDAAPTTTNPPPTSTTPQSLDGVALATASIEAWNSGDLEDWLVRFEQPVQDSDVLFSQSVMNSNEQMDLTGPCAITTEPEGPLAVTCPIHVEDDSTALGV